MIQPNTSTIVLLALVPLLAWRIYSRVRRLVGRQRFSAVRAWLAVTVLPVFGALLLLSSMFRIASLASLVLGAAIGCGLGVYGLRLTRFEPSADGFFHTPSAHIGIGLSLLLVGRVLYRVFMVATFVGATHASSIDFVRSPLTLVIVGTLLAYYVSYAAGLLHWQRHGLPAARAGEATPTDAPP